VPEKKSVNETNVTKNAQHNLKPRSAIDLEDDENVSRSSQDEPKSFGRYINDITIEKKAVKKHQTSF
jgi:hypothetical protein